MLGLHAGVFTPLIAWWVRQTVKLCTAAVAAILCAGHVTKKPARPSKTLTPARQARLPWSLLAYCRTWLPCCTPAAARQCLKWDRRFWPNSRGASQTSSPSRLRMAAWLPCQSACARTTSEHVQTATLGEPAPCHSLRGAGQPLIITCGCRDQLLLLLPYSCLAAAFRNLSCSTAASKAAIARAAVVGDLVLLLSSPSRVVQQQAAGVLSNLCDNASKAVQQACIHSAAAAALLQLLRSSSASAAAQEEAALALFELASFHVSHRRVIVAQPGSIDALQRLLANAAATQATVESALQTLRQLTFEEYYAQVALYRRCCSACAAHTLMLQSRQHRSWVTWLAIMQAQRMRMPLLPLAAYQPSQLLRTGLAG